MRSRNRRLARPVPARGASLLGVAALALFVLVAGAAGAESRPAPPRPNLLLYLVDTLRADALGSYGNPVVETPHIDALASEGMLFEQAFAASTWTRASMASILTGLEAPAHGTEQRNDALSGQVALVAERLREAGYRTGFVNTNPNAGSAFGFGRGFDDMIELYARREAGYVSTTELIARGEEVVERAVAWIGEAPEPFFLVVLSIDPHAPYQPPPGFDRYGGDYVGPVSVDSPHVRRLDPSAADRARLRSLYDGEVAYSDASFGVLVARLRETGVYERTATLLSSDHGEEFWEHGTRGHGRNLYDPTLRVPLILRYPPRVPAGRRSSRLARSIDLGPTLLELAGLSVPRDLDGRSLLADARAPDADPAGDEAFSSLQVDEQTLYALRTERWKLIWSRSDESYRLFDLRAGDGEQRDVAGEHPEVARQLRDRLRRRVDRSRQAHERLHGSARAPQVAPHEIPEADRALLRELGYLDDGD